MRMPSTVAGRLCASGPRASGRLAAWVRRHWPLALLLTAGLALRILTQVAYRPALFYIDSIKYIFGAYPGDDPPGYQLVLKPFLAVANLDMVAAVQHLLGLAMAVALYALLLRRGAPRWLAALAVAPVLLDGYQLQMEQTVMPDVLFEALLAAGLVVLLWRPVPRLWMLLVAGVLLGSTATMWEPGEILIVPAVIYVLFVAAGWRRTLRNAALVCVAFALPIVLVSYRDYVKLGHFSLAPNAASTIYGRMALAADCQMLRLPSYEEPLCPPHQLAVRLGPDGLDHAQASPLKHYVPPPGQAQHGVATDFSRRVLAQQPFRVAGSILRDAMKLFEVHRVSSPGDTWIGRWQFQAHYPTYPPYVQVAGGQVEFSDLGAGGVPVLLGTGPQFGGGGPVVVKPLAAFLRGYQLDGGYTPGPLLLIALVAGLAGSALLLRRRKHWDGPDRDAARACCCLLASGVVLLLLADAFEFSWRYQLPAVITLPPAGALGITVIIAWLRSLRRSRSGESGPGTTASGPATTVSGPGTAAGPAGGRPQAAASPATGNGSAGTPGTEPQDQDHAAGTAW